MAAKGERRSARIRDTLLNTDHEAERCMRQVWIAFLSIVLQGLSGESVYDNQIAKITLEGSHGIWTNSGITSPYRTHLMEQAQRTGAKAPLLGTKPSPGQKIHLF